MSTKAQFNNGKNNLLRVSDEEFKILFYNRLSSADNLTDVALGTIKVLGDLRSRGAAKIGFTCGIITSDGAEHVDQNMKRHAMYTAILRSKMTFPVFSGSDVFNDEKMHERVKHSPQENWFELWRNVLNSGFVTDLFFTPRWEKSSGARDEHEVAKKLNLKIYYVQSKLDEQLMLTV